MQSLMSIKFEKITPTVTQIDELFFLIKSRKYSISRKSIPSKKEHSNFVFNHPYRVWYLIYKNKNLAGSIYLHKDNSIGIDLLEFNKNDVFLTIKFIKDKHKPLQSIKSVRSKEFFINVASKNQQLIRILKDLNMIEIQRSFFV